MPPTHLPIKQWLLGRVVPTTRGIPPRYETNKNNKKTHRIVVPELGNIVVPEFGNIVVPELGNVVVPELRNIAIPN